MSDIMIPGVTDSVFDDDMIDQLMEVERRPVTRMEEQVNTYQEQREAWEEIGRRLSALRDSSRTLFSFENPFNDRVADSTDESVVTAAAERGAARGTTTVEVLETAQADRFLSRPLPSDFAVPAGRYGFSVGEDQITFTFSGGSLEAFAETLNRRAGDLVRAVVVRNTANTKIVMIEALRTGAENTLRFLDDARSFALSASILEEAIDTTIQPPIQASTVVGWTQPLRSEAVTIQSGTLRVGPGGEAKIRFPAPVSPVDARVMELDVWVENFYEPWSPPEPPPGPEVESPGDLTLGDITITAEPSRAPLPDWEPPEPPTVAEDPVMLFAESSGSVVPLPALADSSGFQTIRIPLADYVESIRALNVRNNNTHRRVFLKNIRVFDPTTRGDTTPVNPVSTASDARLRFEGIEVVRPSNTIDDLIDGVTLSLHGPSTRPVQIAVSPDRESIQNSLIDFVFKYNRLLSEINILTRSDRSVVDEIEYLTDEEREEALERLGRLQGDMTLSNLRSRLQTIAMNAYSTEAGSELALLAQLGISTNETGFGGSYDASRLRGYLEMNTTKLNTALDQNFASTRQLFGRDTDGDQVVDSGVGFEVDQLIRPYVKVGGFVATRTSTIDSSIERTQGSIERTSERLEDREAEYRRDFATMEGALNRMRDSQRALENLPSLGGDRK